MREPIQYTVENKNGVYEYSNSFEVNDTVKIRIIISHPVRERNPIMDIVKSISIKGEKVPFDNSGTDWSGHVSTVNDLRTKVIINNTSDLKFELIENSKIQIMLLFKEHESSPCNYTPPTPVFYNLQDSEFQIKENITPTIKHEFHIENIDGVIKFTPDNIEINKKISLIRAYSIDEKTYLDISFNFHGFLFKRGLDPHGGQNPIQDFRNFCYVIKNIKELEFIDVPENVKIKIQLFESLQIKYPNDYKFVRPIINNNEQKENDKK